MEIIFSSFAVLFCWIWIEAFLFLSVKFNNGDIKKKNQLSLKNFKWIIRLTILILFSLIIFYMFLFENEEFQKTIKFCIGIIR